MPIDVQNVMNVKLPQAFATCENQVANIGGSYSLTITGDQGGQWLINANRPVSITSGGGPADVAVTVSAEDFQKIYDEFQPNAMQLMFSGRVKVSGSQMLFFKMGKLFDLAKV